MRKVIPILCIASFILSCTSKESPDLETTAKDDAFRAGITSGKFAKLSQGYTYYEYANPSADTILVMVHGFSVPSYIWDSTFHAAVSRGFGALRYDTYGRGYSDNPDTMYDVALYSQQLKELLDNLEIDKPVNLLGLSDGGRTITAFASQYPLMVRNLIYVDAAGFESLPGKNEVNATVTDEEINAFKKSDQYKHMAAGQLGDFYDSTRFRGWDRKYETFMKYKGFVRALISTGKNRSSLENEQLKIAASGISVFAFWGEHDQVVKLADVKSNLMKRFPKVELFVLPKAGHLPHMEQAAMFNSILFDQVICCH